MIQVCVRRWPGANAATSSPGPQDFRLRPNMTKGPGDEVANADVMHARKGSSKQEKP